MVFFAILGLMIGNMLPVCSNTLDRCAHENSFKPLLEPEFGENVFGDLLGIVCGIIGLSLGIGVDIITSF